MSEEEELRRWAVEIVTKYRAFWGPGDVVEIANRLAEWVMAGKR